MGFDTDRERLLARLASRVPHDTSFFASVLHSYKVEEKLSDEELAADLGVSQAALARLGLCRRPASGQPEFSDQLRQIGGYAGADPAKLAVIVRRVEAIEGLRGIAAKAAGMEESRTPAPGYARGLMAAARDRTQAEDTEISRGDEEEPGDEGVDED